MIKGENNVDFDEYLDNSIENMKQVASYQRVNQIFERMKLAIQNGRSQFQINLDWPLSNDILSKLSDHGINTFMENGTTYIFDFKEAFKC